MSDSLGEAVDGAMAHAAADAAARLADGKGGPHDARCLNCGKALEGNYCSDCGQSAQSLRRPFWALLGESLETLFSIDGRIARTLPDLLIRPGRMTRAYLDGQRARFIPPFRLYVLASLGFFVLLPLVMGQRIAFVPEGAQNFEQARAAIEQSYTDGDLTEAEHQTALQEIDHAEELWRGGIIALVTPAPPVAEGEEAAPHAPDEEWAGFLPKEALNTIREAGKNGDKEAERFARVMDDPGQLAEHTQRWIPRMMFVLLPVYACLLGLVYVWRRKFLFFDHLIVSLHLHSAMFFAMAICAVLLPVIGFGWLLLALLIYSNVYVYRINRVVYGRGKFSSVLRTLTLDSIYFVILMAALVTAVVLGALSL
jgi:hypothetical protein